MRIQRNIARFSTVILIMLGAWCPARPALAQGTFVTLDYPLAGVTDTEATALTPSGVIVGRYVDSGHVMHGFMLQNGTYTPIDYPGAANGPFQGTDVEWVNASGTISGTYHASDGTMKAFTWRKGVYSTIAAPGATETFGFGISDSGIVTGPECACGFTTASGFMYSQGAFTPINFPGAVGTMPTMLITPSLVVGAYYDGSNYHGFYFYNGVFTSVDHPSASFTWFTGLNPAGEVVGFYTDGTGQHGLMYSINTGAMVSVDVPIAGSSSSEVNGIDPQGDIVGRYVSSDGHTHGYFWSAQ